MKRIANRRSGDRAETFGSALLQLFCAVATVPRPEDFGLFDTVATLLRRDGRLLHAEDSFLVQFKSRTETIIPYREKRFEGLLNQELSLFIGHVNLKAADIKLYSLSKVLSHPNIMEMKGAVVYLESVQQPHEEGILQMLLGEPVLHWTAGHLDDRQFEGNAYEIMKRFLQLERWNRRRRKMGIQTQINWKTNEMPTEGASTYLWNPERATEALEELVPAVQLIAFLATSNVSLVEPVLKVLGWMRTHSVEPDPRGNFTLNAILAAGNEKLRAVLAENPNADIAVQFIPVTLTDDNVDFWLQSHSRRGSGGATRHRGSFDEIRQLGIELGARTDNVAIELGQQWLNEHKCELLGQSEDVILLRTLNP